ncbi:glycosyltransferase family protein [Dongshaea marina]|uniref:glycosyltransferase family 2 protein n=1 Tax=Dongshaea marina TaxID=2047966 RepID=UPI000D3EB2B9|nr:glycosyltransferase family 2 protein [Dongshaea marina]
MPQVFMSIISHNHGDLICKLDCISKLSNRFNIIVKSNVPDDIRLQSYCRGAKITLLDQNYGLGFGHNNNYVFDYCVDNKELSDDDYFILLNPDVVVDDLNLHLLVERMTESSIDIATINLYKDCNYQEYDKSIRHFPKLIDFVNSFLGWGNPTEIDKNSVKEQSEVDWCAGSFMAIRASHYKKLRGFDQGYFMYCEDIDICYRSSGLGKRVTYFPDIQAVHLAKHANRKIFSKHFYWHVMSVFRFLLSRYGLTKMKSIIKP